MTNLSREVAREYPGTITLYLDGNFPFLNGFPLLPHLSHSDGRKLDIAYFDRGPDGGYRPGELRSPIGYWPFEEPAPGETPSLCRTGTWLTTRWDAVPTSVVSGPAFGTGPHARRVAMAHDASAGGGHRAGFHRALSRKTARRRVAVARLSGLPCRATR
jgi:hypothetical protein